MNPTRPVLLLNKDVNVIGLSCKNSQVENLEEILQCGWMRHVISGNHEGDELRKGHVLSAMRNMCVEEPIHESAGKSSIVDSREILLDQIALGTFVEPITCALPRMMKTVHTFERSRVALASSQGRT